MYEDKFSQWSHWNVRNNLKGMKYPGIYVCAISNEDISDTKFSWIKNTVYIGMTISLRGLEGRLKQFDNTIRGKKGHGGADRVRYKHQDYDILAKKLFVAVSPFVCDVKVREPKDLKIMGKVAQFEYDCFAHFLSVFGNVPEFNNTKESKKYSLTYGRK